MSTAIQTQTQPQPPSFILSLRAINPLLLGNVPQKASRLVNLIVGSALFTPEQQEFASQWEREFMELFLSQDPLVAAEAVAFLSIKVITPAAAQYIDNRIAAKQFLPVIGLQSELLTLLLPIDTDIEEFLIECEDSYELMLETTQKLSDITSSKKEAEQGLYKTGSDLRKTILIDAQQSFEMLSPLVDGWKSKIHAVHAEVEDLHKKTDNLNEKVQKNAHELISISTQLSCEQQKIQTNNNEVKKLLEEV